MFVVKRAREVMVKTLTPWESFYPFIALHDHILAKDREVHRVTNPNVPISQHYFNTWC